MTITRSDGPSASSASDVKGAFAELDWHDAVLLAVEVDRRSPGERDEVALLVQWPDGRTQVVRFVDCYAFDAQLNFGVRAPESVLGARCTGDAPRLTEVRQCWASVGVELADHRCFEVTTNSTGGQLRVIARGFEVSDRREGLT